MPFAATPFRVFANLSLLFAFKRLKWWIRYCDQMHVPTHISLLLAVFIKRTNFILWTVCIGGDSARYRDAFLRALGFSMLDSHNFCQPNGSYRWPFVFFWFKVQRKPSTLPEAHGLLECVCVAATALYITIGHDPFPIIYYNSPTTALHTFDRTAKRRLTTPTGLTRSAPTHRTAPHN